MRIVTSLGAAAVLALCGCAMLEQSAKRPPSNCGPGACQFDVTVVSCKNITVSKDPIVVEPGHRGPIQWKLDPHGGWEFYGGGIIVHQNDGEFEPANGNSPFVVTWNNKHQNADKTYKYDVVVQARGGGPVCVLDPSIMN